MSKRYTITDIETGEKKELDFDEVVAWMLTKFNYISTTLGPTVQSFESDLEGQNKRSDTHAVAILFTLTIVVIHIFTIAVWISSR